MSPSLAAAGDSRLAVGAGVGTDGAGPDLLIRLSPRWVIGARAATAFANYHKGDRPPDDYFFKGNNRISGLSAHVDFHPWTEGRWRAPLYVSAGVLGGSRNGVTKGKYTGDPIQIGPDSYVGQTEFGRLRGIVRLSPVSPVLAAGWDNTFTRKRRWGVRLYAGLALADTDTMLSASGGSFSDDPRLAKRLWPLEHNLNTDNWMLHYFPFVGAGVTRRF